MDGGTGLRRAASAGGVLARRLLEPARNQRVDDRNVGAYDAHAVHICRRTAEHAADDKQGKAAMPRTSPSAVTSPST